MRNIEFTDAHRDSLTQLAYQKLIDEPSFEFVQVARALVNDSNILDGFEDNITRTALFPYQLSEIDPSDRSFGYQIWSSQLNGSFHTPGYGQNMSDNETLDKVHFVLMFPSTMSKVDEKIATDITVNVHNNEGWLVEYRKGAEYKHNYNPKYQFEASKLCKSQHGQLASLSNLLELGEIDVGQIKYETWLGGSDGDIEGVWKWADGSLLPDGPTCASIQHKTGNHSQPCTLWANNQPKGGRSSNCLAIKDNLYFAFRVSYIYQNELGKHSKKLFF